MAIRLHRQRQREETTLLHFKPPLARQADTATVPAVSAYEVSSVHLTGYVAAAKATGVWDATEPLLSPACRAALTDAGANRWIPGAVLQEIAGCIVKAYGAEVLDRLNYVSAKDSLSRVVLPFLKVALTITGNSPSTIFSRLAQTSRVSMRGVKVHWTELGPKQGTLRITYPEPPQPWVHIGWRGAIRFAFELTGREGTLDRADYDGTSVLMHLSWR